MGPEPTLFPSGIPVRDVPIGEGAVLLAGYAASVADGLCAGIAAIAEAAPFRHMETPGGWRMSVAITSCGALGWVTDRRGYRYTSVDPETEKPWPPMPPSFAQIAAGAALRAGFAGFAPDSCLVNRYAPGARMSLHQDRNERDLDAPIVSVSLGLPATFQFGGLERSDRPVRVPVVHGDVVVWGGPARLAFHGVLPLKASEHAIGPVRYNLTFRRAR